MKYKKQLQDSVKDCGVMCLLFIIRHYGGNNSIENLRTLTKCDKNGVNAYNLINASKRLGFESYGVECNIENLLNNEILLPCIAHLIVEDKYTHYVVIEKIDINKKVLIIYDPSIGMKRISYDDFSVLWTKVILVLKPSEKIENIKCNSPYKLYFKLLSKYKKLYFIIILMTLFSICFTILCSFYFKTLYDNQNNISIIFIVFLIITVFKIIFDFFRNFFVILLDSFIDYDISFMLVKKVLSLPFSYFNTRYPGEIIHKINESETVKEMLIKIPVILVVDFGIIISSTCILYLINRELLIYVFISLVLYFVIFVFYNKKNKACIKEIYEIKSINTSLISEYIYGINTLKNHNLNIYAQEKLKSVINLYIKKKKYYEKIYNIQYLIKELIVLIGSNIVIYIGFVCVNNNNLSIGNLILFNSIMIYLIESTKNLFELESLIKNGILSMKKNSEMLNIDVKEKVYYDNEIDKVSIKGLNHELYSDLYVEIKRNDKILLQGESSSGKTTLLKIITKQIEIEDNMVFINDNDINNWNEYKIRDKICYISNNEKIFNGTIYENIVFNNLYEKDNIENVLKILNIEYLNLGKYVSEENTNLSFGEKQKVILARALINKEIDMLILDEALDGIDFEEREKILRRLINIYKNKILIYVSHSTISKDLFNKIINLENKRRRENEIYRN